ncbi:hypothetical protein GYMLUDRAFT_88463 [Collybiopsis luxurians FD-317 M1]|uniref:Uncharacterized protein n=1 Tax=Collybiopsis luxurians FD-317 M1 TaxID=944289 RepID=A0A0D0BU73_9AGAR|nr:hypothetical protein GYMLUDRAFT_88463 [Collybiopsis luxurians FD-317 M1]
MKAQPLKLLADKNNYANTDVTCLPNKLPNSLYMHRLHHPSIKGQPSVAVPTRVNSTTSTHPSYPMPAFTPDRSLFSSVNIAQGILEWIRPNSILYDGYSLAGDDSCLFISTAFKDSACYPSTAEWVQALLERESMPEPRPE